MLRSSPPAGGEDLGTEEKSPHAHRPSYLRPPSPVLGGLIGRTGRATGCAAVWAWAAARARSLAAAAPTTAPTTPGPPADDWQPGPPKARQLQAAIRMEQQPLLRLVVQPVPPQDPVEPLAMLELP